MTGCSRLDSLSVFVFPLPGDNNSNDEEGGESKGKCVDDVVGKGTSSSIRPSASMSCKSKPGSDAEFRLERASDDDDDK